MLQVSRLFLHIFVRQNILTSRRSHPTTTLECWREVNAFKDAVSHVEQVGALTLSITYPLT